MAKELFEKATRAKFRFNSIRGIISTEDLWDLPLSGLNSEAKALNRRIKDAEDEDFLSNADTTESETLKLKFAVVLHILETKKAEKEARSAAAKTSVQREKLLAALARKEDSAIDDMSVDDIKKSLEEL